MTDVLYPDWSNKAARAYTKTTLTNEPPIDFLTIEKEIAVALWGQDAGSIAVYVSPEKDNG